MFQASITRFWARRRSPGHGAAALLLLLSLQVAGCAPGRDLAFIPDYTTKGYTLGSGDQIRIITFGEDQLTGEFRVDDQGRIALPLLGSVEAAGLTSSELDTRISGELRRRNLLRDPSVSVEVLAYRPIFVLGEVAKPGQYPFQPGMTMLTTVAVAGGFTYRGFQEYASVVRTTTGEAVEGRITPRSFIAPGDVVNVYERRF
ncbi:polysaccharide biosynthesis/export family protein [Roseomonas sp. BN140053]|uniref:polysaccharide biosynthesis/export family protein n=1 Tax=Roseomonas sp. BN140053 TaxID=3391898 RepID=UPI0039ED685B